MDITALEYFKIIAESGSLTKAAQQLHITQPAMSAMLKKLRRNWRWSCLTVARIESI